MRNLTQTNAALMPNHERLNRSAVFSNFFGGEFPVPAGVTSLYVTGCAAGGRHADSLSPTTEWTVDNSAGGRTLFAVSASGNICAASHGSPSTNTSLAGVLIDLVGRKISRNGTSNAIYWNRTNKHCAAADNGFVIFQGGAGGAYQKRLGEWTGTGVGYGDYQRIALAPAHYASATSSTRCCALETTATDLSAFNGSSFSSATYSGKVFVSMSYTNGYFVAGETSGGTTRVYFKTEALAQSPSGWSSATVVASTKTIYAIAYGAGLYVAVCSGGSIYTATALNGTWTSRTSGTASNLTEIKFAGGRFVAAGAGGATTTSTDGITWTAATAGASDIQPFDLHYMDTLGLWVVSSGAKTVYTATTPTSWTQQTTLFGSTTVGIAATPCGLIYDDGSSIKITPDPRGSTYYTFSTSSDGGDAVIARQSDAVELLRLGGGFAGSSTTGGNGGSTEGRYVAGGTSTLPAVGVWGNGAVTTTLPATGNGGVGAANIYGGGGCPLVTANSPTVLYGTKIPGGAGAGWAASGKSGGGGSIFVAGGSANVTPADAGGGMGSATTGGGGGGESVVRYRIDVTPGETLLISSGLAQMDIYSNANPAGGKIIVEWEAV